MHKAAIHFIAAMFSPDQSMTSDLLTYSTLATAQFKSFCVSLYLEICVSLECFKTTVVFYKAIVPDKRAVLK